MTTLEIAVQDVAGAMAAVDAGADRLELCVALAETGGLTPSLGLIERVVAAVPVGVHVLVRPRPGGFEHDAAEHDVMRRDIAVAVGAGASGVVVGALRAGRVDAVALADLVAAARGAEVTFHRAFDVVPDVTEALAGLAAAGVTRVLTSGGAPRTIDGLDRLVGTVAAADGVQVMAGGGVRPVDIAAIVATGVDAVHLSAGVRREDPGGPGGGPGGRTVTDPALGAAVRAALDA